MDILLRAILYMYCTACSSYLNVSHVHKINQNLQSLSLFSAAEERVFLPLNYLKAPLGRTKNRDARKGALLMIQIGDALKCDIQGVPRNMTVDE